MFYLFILDSIGTSELLMIGLVALIIFGPRRLPEMMRTVGKAIAEFRRSTEDFKNTWEKEVSSVKSEFENTEDTSLLMGIQPKTAITKSKSIDSVEENKISAPKIREISREDFPTDIPTVKTPLSEKVRIEVGSTDKQSWL